MKFAKLIKKRTNNAMRNLKDVSEKIGAVIGLESDSQPAGITTEAMSSMTAPDSRVVDFSKK